MYPPDEGLQRVERRAAPKPARASHETWLALMPSKPTQVGLEPRHSLPSGAEPGREQSSGLFTPGEGLGHLAQRGLQDRPMYPSDEGLH